MAIMMLSGITLVGVIPIGVIPVGDPAQQAHMSAGNRAGIDLAPVPQRGPDEADPADSPRAQPRPNATVSPPVPGLRPEDFFARVELEGCLDLSRNGLTQPVGSLTARFWVAGWGHCFEVSHRVKDCAQLRMERSTREAISPSEALSPTFGWIFRATRFSRARWRV